MNSEPTVEEIAAIAYECGYHKRDDEVAALRDELARSQAEVQRLISANEGWHTRVRQLNNELDAARQQQEAQP